MLEEIDRQQCEMDICCKGALVGELSPAAEALGASVMHCPLRPDHVRFGRRLSDILRTGNYDIVHNHLGVYAGFPTWIARREGVPVIASFRSTHFLPDAMWGRLPVLRQLRSFYCRYSVSYALREADLVTPISQGVQDELAAFGVDFAARSRLIYHGVTIPQAASEEERQEFRRSLGWEPDALVIAHVGSFRRPKNHEGILAAFRQVAAREPGARLLLVGDGDLRCIVEESVRRSGLNGSVHLMGNRDDVPALLTKCDVFFMPSLSEGFGRAAIEASAAGLPVVASSIPGLAEAVVDGETGILRDVSDADGMADALCCLLRDGAAARALGAAGRARVEQSFSRSAAARRLLEVYDECIRLK